MIRSRSWARYCTGPAGRVPVTFRITVFLAELARVVELVAITQRITLCRDPRDDKFLELALAGRADFLVTGDVDLLTLDPFHGTAIMDPATYLGRP